MHGLVVVELVDVGQLQIDLVRRALNGVTQHFATQVGMTGGIFGERLRRLLHTTHRRSTTTTGFRHDIGILEYRHHVVRLQQSIEVLGNVILQHEGLRAIGVDEDIVEGIALVVDISLEMSDGRCSGVIDGQVDGQHVGVDHRLARVADTIGEVIAKLHLVHHQIGMKVANIGQCVERLDLQSVERGSIARHNGTVGGTTQGDMRNRRHVLAHEDTRTVQHGLRAVGRRYLSVAVDIFVATFPQHGKILGFLVVLVDEDLDGLRVIAGNGQIGAIALVATHHIDFLDVDIFVHAIYLVQDGDGRHGANHIEREADGFQLVGIDIPDGLVVGFAVVAQLHFIFALGHHQHGSQHGIVAHQDLIVGDDILLVDLHNTLGSAPLLTIENRQHEVAFEGAQSIGH